MSNGMIAIFIILIILVGAVWTRRCTEFLLLGSLLGAIVLYGKDFLTEWCMILQNSVADNAWLWLVCGLFGSLIALLQASKGTFGFSKIISKICTTERKTMFASYIMGILIFVDDYLNVLSIGVCMKGVFDKKKLLSNRRTCDRGSFLCGMVPEAWCHEKAYKRVEETGKVYSDISKKYNHDDRKGYDETD